MRMSRSGHLDGAQEQSEWSQTWGHFLPLLLPLPFTALYPVPVCTHTPIGSCEVLDGCTLAAMGHVGVASVRVRV